MFNIFTEKTLGKIAKKTVKQGGQREKIDYYYKILAKEFCDEYTEANFITMKEYLNESFNNSIDELENYYFKGYGV